MQRNNLAIGCKRSAPRYLCLQAGRSDACRSEGVPGCEQAGEGHRGPGISRQCPAPRGQGIWLNTSASDVPCVTNGQPDTVSCAESWSPSLTMLVRLSPGARLISCMRLHHKLMHYEVLEGVMAVRRCRTMCWTGWRSSPSRTLRQARGGCARWRSWPRSCACTRAGKSSASSLGKACRPLRSAPGSRSA